MDKKEKDLSKSKYSFDFVEIVSSSKSNKEHIRIGLSKTWGKFIGKPREFKIVIANFFQHPRTGKRLNMSSEYDPDRDTFTFAIEEMRNRIKINFSEDETLFLLAAHECYHAVQCYEERRPMGSLSNPNYNDDIHEEEAWKTAIKVFKEEYPNASGQFKAGNKIYSFD